MTSVLSRGFKCRYALNNYQEGREQICGRKECSSCTFGKGIREKEEGEREGGREGGKEGGKRKRKRGRAFCCLTLYLFICRLSSVLNKDTKQFGERKREREKEEKKEKA